MSIKPPTPNSAAVWPSSFCPTPSPGIPNVLPDSIEKLAPLPCQRIPRIGSTHAYKTHSELEGQLTALSLCPPQAP